MNIRVSFFCILALTAGHLSASDISARTADKHAQYVFSIKTNYPGKTEFQGDVSLPVFQIFARLQSNKLPDFSLKAYSAGLALFPLASLNSPLDMGIYAGALAHRGIFQRAIGLYPPSSGLSLQSVGAQPDAFFALSKSTKALSFAFETKLFAAKNNTVQLGFFMQAADYINQPKILFPAYYGAALGWQKKIDFLEIHTAAFFGAAPKKIPKRLQNKPLNPVWHSFYLFETGITHKHVKTFFFGGVQHTPQEKLSFNIKNHTQIMFKHLDAALYTSYVSPDSLGWKHRKITPGFIIMPRFKTHLSFFTLYGMYSLQWQKDFKQTAAHTIGTKIEFGFKYLELQAELQTNLSEFRLKNKIKFSPPKAKAQKPDIRFLHAQLDSQLDLQKKLQNPFIVQKYQTKLTLASQWTQTIRTDLFGGIEQKNTLDKKTGIITWQPLDAHAGLQFIFKQKASQHHELRFELTYKNSPHRAEVSISYKLSNKEIIPFELSEELPEGGLEPPSSNEH